MLFLSEIYVNLQKIALRTHKQQKEKVSPFELDYFFHIFQSSHQLMESEKIFTHPVETVTSVVS